MKSDRIEQLDECLRLLGQVLQRAGELLGVGYRPGEIGGSACIGACTAEPQDLWAPSAAQCVDSCTVQPREQTTASGSMRTAATERLTRRQLAAIRFLARRAGVTSDQLAGMVRLVGAQASCVDQLTRAEASALLDRLDEQDSHYRH